jgi:hypothetical protein
VLTINVTGNVTVDGNVTANGGPPQGSNNTQTGGAGGSLTINVGDNQTISDLAINGTIAANGHAGNNKGSAGGAGGTVTLDITRN